MRAYFFGNTYLSSIQQGLQAAHAVADMFCVTEPNTTQSEILTEWATEHKTIILLNAGYASNIHDLIQFFSSDQNPFPWAPFYEEQAALDGAVTTVGIVLPEKIYIGSKLLNSPPNDGTVHITMESNNKTITVFEGYGLSESGPIVWRYTDWEHQLMVRLSQFPLAR